MFSNPNNSVHNELYSVYTVQLSSKFNSCPQGPCEGIGETLRKDDSCTSAWSSTLNYLLCTGTSFLNFSSPGQMNLSYVEVKSNFSSIHSQKRYWRKNPPEQYLTVSEHFFVSTNAFFIQYEPYKKFRFVCMYGFCVLPAPLSLSEEQHLQYSFLDNTVCTVHVATVLY